MYVSEEGANSNKKEQNLAFFFLLLNMLSFTCLLFLCIMYMSSEGK